MKKEFHELYDLMSNSKKVENMRTFGTVHKEMMDWMIQNKPDLAAEWIGKLESIKWKNYLTPARPRESCLKCHPKLRGRVMLGTRQWTTQEWRRRRCLTTIRAPSM